MPDAPPGRYPPAARLAPVADAAAPQGGRPVRTAGTFRVEFGKGLEFRALLDESGEPAAVLVTRESLYAARDIPYRRVPIFAPGMGESWEQDETLLWPYAEAQPTRGPCVKQQTRWLFGNWGHDARAAAMTGAAVQVPLRRSALPSCPQLTVGIAWFLRYRPLSKRSSRRIVQNWTSGRAWWNVYDDGILFFRTLPDPAAAGQGVDR